MVFIGSYNNTITFS